MKDLGFNSRRVFFAALLVAGLALVPLHANAQNFVPATTATCDRGDLTDEHDTTRFNPEWAPIQVDSTHPLPNNLPNILEGLVAPVPATEDQNSQASTEVSEEEVPWNHYTHDYTFKVVPDPLYSPLLASWTRFPADASFTIPGTEADSALQCIEFHGTYLGNNKCLLVAEETCPDGQKTPTCHRPHMEVEWENGSAMHVNGDSANNTREWGSLPEFAWPSSGDRVWVEGRWIFDCGHTGVGENYGSASDLGLLPNSSSLNDWVKYDSEIHPPRALATFRLNHTVLSQESISNQDGNPYRSVSDDPSSWLPVTGAALPQPVVSNPPWTPPTFVPVTEADIFVSGNGGGANDLCNIVNRSDSSGDCSPFSHTGAVIPINNYNYVFDIYPPGAHFESLIGNGPPMEKSGAIPVTPPVPNASLQWRIVDHFNEIPVHTCGPDKNSCTQADPILCLVGPSTPPPPSDPIAQTQLGITCPTLQPGESPTRLRVILPFFSDAFQGKVDNYYAQSILLGWDDVPDPTGLRTPDMRRFSVTLEDFQVNQNGRCTLCGDGDWRVFVDVGGQWRWMSWLYDTNQGVFAFDGGDNSGHGDPLTENGDNDFYFFTKKPWIVDVVDGRNIHVAVGGYDSGPSDGGYCDSFSGSNCDYGIWNLIGLGVSDAIALARIGTYEFDLSPGDCTSSCTFQIPETETERQYTTSFKVQEIPSPAAPTSTLQLGDPHFNNFISSATPLVFSTPNPGVQGFQYRFQLQGGPLPTYASSPFPVHWTSVNLVNPPSVAVNLSGVSAMGDGPYDFQYSAESVWNLLEPRHAQTVSLDNTPPVTTITTPTATQYGHSSPLTLAYNTTDSAGSGVKSSTPRMDGQTATQFGASLDNGQTIYLYSMALGSHTFSVESLDNVNNDGTNSVTFSITVTPDSLLGDVNDLVALGCITNIDQSLIAKISAAKSLIDKGQIKAAINTLSALIHEVQAQAGKHISTICHDPGGRPFNPVQLLIGDAQYLQSILASQVKANPITGVVASSINPGINGVTVSLMSSAKTAAATTITDLAGFYYFADTSGLTSGSTYTVKVTVPKAYKRSTPASQTFTWSGNSVTGNFMLN